MRYTLFALIMIMAVASSADAKQIWAKSYLGKEAPAFVVEKWLTAAPQTKGKFILLDFWATWCPPCRKAIPELNELAHQFGDKLCVIGISDEPEKTVRALRDPKIEYAVAIDPTRRMYSQLQIKGIPHILLIDPKGIVRWEGFPFLDGEELTPAVVKQIIEQYSAP